MRRGLTRGALFQARHPSAQLVHRDLNPVNPLAQLCSGEVDVAHVWLSVREPWPNLVYLPIRDAPSVELALVWRTVDESKLIRALAEVVRDNSEADLAS